MRRGHLERNILFLCRDGAPFSRTAEATAEHLAPPGTRIFSAGATMRGPDGSVEA